MKTYSVCENSKIKEVFLVDISIPINAWHRDKKERWVCEIAVEGVDGTMEPFPLFDFRSLCESRNIGGIETETLKNKIKFYASQQVNVPLNLSVMRISAGGVE